MPNFRFMTPAVEDALREAFKRTVRGVRENPHVPLTIPTRYRGSEDVPAMYFHSPMAEHFRKAAPVVSKPGQTVDWTWATVRKLLSEAHQGERKWSRIDDWIKQAEKAGVAEGLNKQELLDWIHANHIRIRVTQRPVSGLMRDLASYLPEHYGPETQHAVTVSIEPPRNMPKADVSKLIGDGPDALFPRVVHPEDVVPYEHMNPVHRQLWGNRNNVIGHFRYSSVGDLEKGLRMILHEGQADWGQEARRLGRNAVAGTAAGLRRQRVYEHLAEQAKRVHGLTVSKYGPSRQGKRMRLLWRQYQNKAGGRAGIIAQGGTPTFDPENVPPYPLEGHWPELMARIVMQLARAGKYQELLLPSGSQVAEKYNRVYSQFHGAPVKTVWSPVTPRTSLGRVQLEANNQRIDPSAWRYLLPDQSLPAVRDWVRQRFSRGVKLQPGAVEQATPMVYGGPSGFGTDVSTPFFQSLYGEVPPVRPETPLGEYDAIQEIASQGLWHRALQNEMKRLGVSPELGLHYPEGGSEPFSYYRVNWPLQKSLKYFTLAGMAPLGAAALRQRALFDPDQQGY